FANRDWCGPPRARSPGGSDDHHEVIAWIHRDLFGYRRAPAADRIADESQLRDSVEEIARHGELRRVVSRCDPEAVALSVHDGVDGHVVEILILHGERRPQQSAVLLRYVMGRAAREQEGEHHGAPASPQTHRAQRDRHGTHLRWCGWERGATS